MRAVLTLLATLAVAPAAAAAEVDVLVVGKTHVVDEGRVTLRAATVRTGGRRCRVAAATPLAVLVRTGLPVRVRDYGSCSRDVRDGASLFVTRVGDDANRGRDGWVYKAGNRAGTRGAGDAGHRLRDGGRVLWFWCRMRTDGCQRTLVVDSASRTALNSTLRVVVRGYDDGGRGIPVEGATVEMLGKTATTGADGVAYLEVDGVPGRQRLVADHPRMVRSFAKWVMVG